MTENLYLYRIYVFIIILSITFNILILLYF